MSTRYSVKIGHQMRSLVIAKTRVFVGQKPATIKEIYPIGPRIFPVESRRSRPPLCP
jgi:hypothetical protein